MGPLEITLIGVVVLLLFGARLLPKWGSALGETLGYVRGKSRDKIE
jgi:TatA/E family protein of Tat protein translocase